MLLIPPVIYNFQYIAQETSPEANTFNNLRDGLLNKIIIIIVSFDFFRSSILIFFMFGLFLFYWWRRFFLYWLKEFPGYPYIYPCYSSGL